MKKKMTTREKKKSFRHRYVVLLLQNQIIIELPSRSLRPSTFTFDCHHRHLYRTGSSSDLTGKYADNV